MTMREKLIKKVQENWPSSSSSSETIAHGFAAQVVDAILDVLREPDEGMMVSAQRFGWDSAPEVTFTAMIDHVRKG